MQKRGARYKHLAPQSLCLKNGLKSSFFILYFSISNRSDILSPMKAYLDVFSQNNTGAKEDDKTLDIRMNNAI